MAGDFAGAERQLDRIAALESRMDLGHGGDAYASALIAVRLWQGDVEPLIDEAVALEGGPFPVTSLVLVLMLRSGRRADALAHLRRHRIELDIEDWYSMFNWGMAAEVAFRLADPILAAAAYQRLAPYAGRVCSAGSSLSNGPVDAFLALAASAVGERGLASDHANRASRLIERWGIPQAGRWLDALRAESGF
jgi:hypothetical protein